MAMLEQALVFDGSQGPLVGILARPVTDCRAAPRAWTSSARSVAECISNNCFLSAR